MSTAERPLQPVLRMHPPEAALALAQPPPVAEDLVIEGLSEEWDAFQEAITRA